MPNPIKVEGEVKIDPAGGDVFVRVRPENIGGPPGFVFSSVVRILAGSGSLLPDINNPLALKRVGDPALLLNGGLGRSLIVAASDDIDTTPQQIANVCEFRQDGNVIYGDRQEFELANTQTVRWLLAFVASQAEEE